MNNLSDPEFYKTLDLQLQKKIKWQQIQLIVLYVSIIALAIKLFI